MNIAINSTFQAVKWIRKYVSCFSLRFVTLSYSHHTGGNECKNIVIVSIIRRKSISAIIWKQKRNSCNKQNKMMSESYSEYRVEHRNNNQIDPFKNSIIKVVCFFVSLRKFNQEFNENNKIKAESIKNEFSKASEHFTLIKKFSGAFLLMISIGEFKSKECNLYAFVWSTNCKSIAVNSVTIVFFLVRIFMQFYSLEEINLKEKCHYHYYCRIGQG